MSESELNRHKNSFGKQCLTMRFQYHKPTSRTRIIHLSFFFLLRFTTVLSLAPHVHRRAPSNPSSRFQASSQEIDSDSLVEDEKSSSSSSSATYFSPNRPLDRIGFNNVTAEERLQASIESSANEYSFFDEATIYVRAGSGGQGSSTYKKGTGGQDGPPDGGQGGKGGNVIMIVDESLNTLAGLTNAWRPNSFGGSGAASQPVRDQRKSFRAENGNDGLRQLKNGRYGKDVSIRVPPGTVVQEVIEREDGTEELFDIGTLVLDEPSLLIAVGGDGGEGSGINTKGRGVKKPRVSPQGGERKTIRLTLKIVADVALVGVPNAGKSTFLSAVTRAKPKIANYPFTTVIPNLGVWVPPRAKDDNTAKGITIDGAGSEGLVLCDVPGLIAGAAQGVGLGHAFLRHVERCHVILHLVDATSDDPVADFEMLNRELVNYGTGQLARMPQVVVVNKLDALEGRGGEDWEAGLKTRHSREDLAEKLTEAMSHSRLMWMSAKERDGVDDLMLRLATFVKKVKETASV